MLSALVAALVLTQTPLVTGNGHGFATFAGGTLTTLYAHPYSFAGPDPKDPLSEGVPTASFITSMRWEGMLAVADYENDSHVIRAGDARFFMPFGLDRHVLITTWRGAGTPSLAVKWAHPIVKREQVGRATLIHFSGVDETLLMIPLGPGAHPNAIAFAALSDPRDAANAVSDISAYAIDSELPALEAWRASPPPGLTEIELHLWRQSEVVLRMAQSREANRPGRYNNGMIVAVLPDSAWSTYWARDMAYAIHALTRLGHKDEAKRGLMAYFNARPTGRMDVGAPYQVSVVRYFATGEEQPFFTQEGATNVEFDDWGEVLWVLGEYIDTFGDAAILDEQAARGTVRESVQNFIVTPLLANLEPYQDGLIVKADTSIWEERQKDAKHFAFSTLMAIVGLRRFAEPSMVAKLERGFAKAYISRGRLRGTLEPGPKNDIDGAVLAAINFGVVTDPKVIEATVNAMERLKTDSGGYRRVTCQLTDPSIFEYWYERQEFLFIDFSLAEVQLRQKRPEKAAELINTIVSKAAVDHFVVPEMYVSVVNPLFKGPIGAPTGAKPMVGYGAGAYVAYVIERHRLGDSQQ